MRTAAILADVPFRGCSCDGRSAPDPSGLGFLQRLLLVTDGTVTLSLAAYAGEGIEAVRLSQSVRIIEERQEELDLRRRRRVLDRRVLLRGMTSRRNYAHGESVVALGRLPRAVRNGLLRTGTPIGVLLREHRVETFRDILWSGWVTAGALGPSFLVDEHTRLLARTYRVWTNGRPAMLITERFPEVYVPGPSPAPLDPVS